MRLSVTLCNGVPGFSLFNNNVQAFCFCLHGRCLSKELYVHYGSKKVRKVRLNEHPLQLQLSFLQELGHSNPYRMQLEGLKEDLPALFKFVAGESKRGIQS